MNALQLSSISRIGFLLLPNFSMIAFTNAVEPLRMANQLSGQRLYSWSQLSSNDKPVTASNGLVLAPITPLDNPRQYDVLIVCGGHDIREAISDETLDIIRRFAKEGVPLAAICTGAYALAKAGALNGYQSAIHWEKLHAVRELFPTTEFTSDLYVIDRDRMTCSGGTAPLDLMCNLIRCRGGKSLALSVSEQFIVERIRDQRDQQRIPLLSRVGTGQAVLLHAAQVMETHIENPRTLEELSCELGVSKRQLQRLFKQYLGTKPAQYYIDLRLRRARELLQQTNMSVMEVTVACGFTTPGYLGRAYRKQFGYPPSRERQQMQA